MTGSRPSATGHAVRARQRPFRGVADRPRGMFPGTNPWRNVEKL